MARICAIENITLDGVLQGPGRPDEDTRGGFRHGGWGNGYSDDVMTSFMSEGMTGEGVMLFGRRTYQDVLGHWTAVTEPNPFTDYLTRAPKYVVSRSSETALGYPNSTLLPGEAIETVARFKEEIDAPVSILGSGELVRALHGAGLIDAFVLQIYPIVLGSGTRLFGSGERADLRLERSVTSTTGVIIAQYAAS